MFGLYFVLSRGSTWKCLDRVLHRVEHQQACRHTSGRHRTPFHRDTASGCACRWRRCRARTIEDRPSPIASRRNSARCRRAAAAPAAPPRRRCASSSRPRLSMRTLRPSASAAEFMPLLSRRTRVPLLGPGETRGSSACRADDTGCTGAIRRATAPASCTRPGARSRREAESTRPSEPTDRSSRPRAGVAASVAWSLTCAPRSAFVRAESFSP